jgi:hypothetical protein
MLLRFQVPNLKSVFFRLGLYPRNPSESEASCDLL